LILSSGRDDESILVPSYSGNLKLDQEISSSSWVERPVENITQVEDSLDALASNICKNCL
jgi:hypothetical protein